MIKQQEQTTGTPKSWNKDDSNSYKRFASKDRTTINRSKAVTTKEQ